MNRNVMSKETIARERLNYLKTELFCYPENKKLLEDPKILSTRQVIYIQYIISSIDLAFKILRETHSGEYKLKLIQDMYWESYNLDHFDLSYKHFIHVNTVRIWEKQFFLLLSEILGLRISF